MKYPRTFHLPFSPGVYRDDKVQYDLRQLLGQKLVYTEKMDGICTTMTSDECFDRSPDSKPDKFNSYVRGLWGSIKYRIPKGMRICGENVYAKHSIHYTNLPDYFLVFNIWQDDICLSWEDTERICKEFGLCTVPILVYDIPHIEKNTLFNTLENFGKERIDTTKQEGFVVRPTRLIHKNDFPFCVLKWVRDGHVQTDQHWREQPLIKNKLYESRSGTND